MYTSLSIQNFRGIRTLEMNDFRRVNILTGKNNCGKTSVLEAVYLLSRSDNPGSLAHLGAYRRFDTLDEHYWGAFFHNFEKQVLVAGVMSGKIEKKIALAPKYTADSFSVEIPEEWLKTVEKIEIDPEHILGVSVTSTYAIAATGTHLQSAFSIGRKIDNAKDLEIIWNEPKVVIPPLPTTLFIHPAYLTDAIRRFGFLEVRKETDLIVKPLQAIEPAIQYIRVINETFYCEVGKERLLPMNVMGDGMVRMFSIILAIATTPGGVVLIDEIDTGFHYSTLEVMWKAVYAAAKQFDVQIFATTHSYECLRALSSLLESQPENPDDTRLYRLEKEEPGHRVIRYDVEVLEAALDNYWEVR